MGNELPEMFSKYFIGQAYLQPLTDKGGPIANVTFQPGCRNNWHIHHKGGQILLVTGGRGWYQAWGEPARELHPGDVVNIPPEVKHWHGAAKKTGSRIWLSKSRRKARPRSGWRRFPMKRTISFEIGDIIFGCMDTHSGRYLLKH